MPKYRSILALLVGFVTAAAIAIVGSGTAIAQVPPPDPAVSTLPPTSAGSGDPTAMVSHPGSPIWIFVLVAIGTMLVTAVVTYVAAGRRHLSEQLT